MIKNPTRAGENLLVTSLAFGSEVSAPGNSRPQQKYMDKDSRFKWN